MEIVFFWFWSHFSFIFKCPVLLKCLKPFWFRVLYMWLKKKKISSKFIACRLLDSSHPDWRVMVSHRGFDLHFSDNEWCWASFHVFVSHLYVFFGERNRESFIIHTADPWTTQVGVRGAKLQTDENLCITLQVTPVSMDSTSHGLWGATVCGENNRFINGPMQFKPVLFKDQLIIIIYSLFNDRLRG